MLYQQHERRFAQNRYVYPVVSRRSRGISLGINLNPDKVCNFDCIYCQVDRRSPGGEPFVDLPRLLEELEHALQLTLSGALFDLPKFQNTPAALRRLNDIAFSGDGEPTTYRNIDEVVGACAELKERAGAMDVKLVLITNASMFHRAAVQSALRILDAHQGEIWAKLDAGTEEYFRRIDRTLIPFDQILRNLRDAARQRPLVIQSLFMRVAGEPPPKEELQAYCDRLRWICSEGGKIRYVQVCTVARKPAEPYVTPLSDDEVDALCDLICRATGLPAEPFYSAGSALGVSKTTVPDRGTLAD